MQSGYVARRGPILLKTPNHRQETLRRRLVVVCAILALALASGLIGTLIHPTSEAPDRSATGPFSYFPS